MAAKRRTKPKPPRRGNDKDRRCAFVGFGCTTTSVLTDENWCTGCQFYICDRCDPLGFISPLFNSRCGSHDVLEHLESSDE